MEHKTFAQALAELDFDSWYPKNSNIPAHPITQHEPNEAFARIRWSILDSPSKAQIFGSDDKGVLQWRPLFKQSVADEAAMNPPTFRMEIRFQPLQDWWHHWHDAGMKRVENADGQHISVKQFIEAVHDYAVPLRKLLIRCMDIDDPYYWDRARLYLDRISDVHGGGPSECTTQEAAVNVVEDPTGDGEKCAWMWEAIETRVKNKSASQ
jgi:hypothetical protein